MNPENAYLAFVLKYANQGTRVTQNFPQQAARERKNMIDCFSIAKISQFYRHTFVIRNGGYGSELLNRFSHAGLILGQLGSVAEI